MKFLLEHSEGNAWKEVFRFSPGFEFGIHIPDTELFIDSPFTVISKLLLGSVLNGAFVQIIEMKMWYI